MVRYLVRYVNRATPANTSCAGQTSFLYYGKDERVLAHRGSRARATHSAMEFDNAMVEKYGFRREADAKKSACYRMPENTKLWRAEATVVKIEI